jgi:hypothetical protein
VELAAQVARWLGLPWVRVVQVVRVEPVARVAPRGRGLVVAAVVAVDLAA